MENKVKKCFMLHGLGGGVLEPLWGKYVRNEMSKLGYKVIIPRFPGLTKAKYEKWEAVFDKRTDKFMPDENSVVIAHSLGTQFFVKWLVARGIKINTYISIAAPSRPADAEGCGERNKRMINGTMPYFLPSGKEFETFRSLVKNRYAVYGDNDCLFSVENLKGYAQNIDAKEVFLKGYGHFFGLTGLKEIPELVKVVKKLDGLDKTKKCVLLPGISGELNTWGRWLAGELLGHNYQIISPTFPGNKRAAPDKWKKVFDDALDGTDLDGSTVVVAHSMGTQFFVKWLAERNIKIKAFIGVAAPGGMMDIGPKPQSVADRHYQKLIYKVLPKFLPDEHEYEKFASLAKGRFCIYSDNDNLFSVKNMEGYAEKIKAEKIKLDGRGHFGGFQGINELPEVLEIILQLK